jgi:hypothetical protein
VKSVELSPYYSETIEAVPKINHARYLITSLILRIAW